MDVLAELRKVGRGLAPKSPPIPVAFDDMGVIGHVENRRELYINSALQNSVDALLRDYARYECAARDVSNGLLGVDDLLPIAALGTDSRDAIRTIKSMRGAITKWADVQAAIVAGKRHSVMGLKSSLAGTAVWISWLRATGWPAAIAYGNAPGPAALDANTAGAWPCPPIGAADSLYMANMGMNQAGSSASAGTSIVLAVDALQAVGGLITSGTATAQAVSTTALPRWTGGAGLQMILEVTGTFGAGPANVTIAYVNQAGGANTTAASALTTSALTSVLQPATDGPMVRFVTGDYGVRSISTVTLSTSMATTSGNFAALIYKPLILMACFTWSIFFQRLSDMQAGGARVLTEVAGGSRPCLGFFTLPGIASQTTPNTFLVEYVWG